jgi:hypothetical protein
MKEESPFESITGSLKKNSNLSKPYSHYSKSILNGDSYPEAQALTPISPPPPPGGGS